MRGRMDFESGVGELQFGDFVDPATLTDGQKAEWWYSAATSAQWRRARSGALACGPDHAADQLGVLLVPADRCGHPGLDPVRLPPDGRAPIYRKGTYVVVGTAPA